MKPRLVVILGPTATGKSACAIELARRFQGEIISGDSMLVYKNMNIGTAKPTAEELGLVPHHLVDILPPEASFNVVEFKQRAEQLIAEINARGHLPIVAGGTGLYIKSLLEDYRFSEVEEDTELRKQLEQEAELLGREALYARLQELDPEAAAHIDAGNLRRTIRALEAYSKGGHVRQESAGELPYDALVFGLSMERSFLYERINLRVDKMLEAGLLQEVQELLEAGVPVDCQAMQSIGYRQLLWHLQADMTYGEAVDKLKQATRNFAKRQLTWYKKMPYIHWLEVSRELPYGELVDTMSAEIEEHFQLH